MVPLSDDPSNLSALTPAHFLVGRSLFSLPEESYLNRKPSLLLRWQMMNQMKASIWKRWRREYLQSLQARGKWNHTKPNLQVGDLVLVTSEQTEPCQWPLGRINEVFPGADGLVRAAEVKTYTSTLTRPITKLILLPREKD